MGVIMKFNGQKEYSVINGVRQGMFFVGNDFSKPVILFLHGGSSSPEYALYHSDLSKKCLEDYFTICYWEQRGGGSLTAMDFIKRSLHPISATPHTAQNGSITGLSGLSKP